jgi:hypothetical protein
MRPQLIVYPMFALVMLTAIVLVRMFRARVRAVKTGAVSASYFRVYQEGVEPPESAKFSRHFANLFEAPVLFYVACLAGLALDQVSVLLLTFAWLYVLTRLVHAFVHLGSNRLRKRITAYFASWLVLVAMWVALVVNVAKGD